MVAKLRLQITVATVGLAALVSMVVPAELAGSSEVAAQDLTELVVLVARTAAQVRTVIQQAKVATTAHQVEKVENHHMTRMIEVAIMEAEGQVTRQTGETPII
jgi:hypothetical protein|nr:MAG TPA: hypothetical protein [Caudoviricetes sp.]